MKALLYKEFKLAMHPMCYVFITVFPLLILIPKYPIAVGFIYVLSAYPVLFLGANKGQQSNDLLFSTLLPVRKKDIVLARILTVIIMQVIFITVMTWFYPFKVLIAHYIPGPASAGIDVDGYVSILAFAIIGFAFADLGFFPAYYKNGRSILLPTLFTVFGFAIYIMTVTVVIPYIPVIGQPYVDFFSTSKIWIQFIFLAVSIIFYGLIHIIVYKVSAKRLEKVDF